jgi:cytochrome P450
MQIKLRNEIILSGFDAPNMEQLNTLPYLDMVLRESLRLHTIVGYSERRAMEDDIVPVTKPYMDRYGQMRDHIV